MIQGVLLGGCLLLLGALAVIVPVVVKLKVTECLGCKKLDATREELAFALGRLRELNPNDPAVVKFKETH